MKFSSVLFQTFLQIFFLMLAVLALYAGSLHRTLLLSCTPIVLLHTICWESTRKRCVTMIEPLRSILTSPIFIMDGH